MMDLSGHLEWTYLYILAESLLYIPSGDPVDLHTF